MSENQVMLAVVGFAFGMVVTMALTRTDRRALLRKSARLAYCLQAMLSQHPEGHVQFESAIALREWDKEVRP